MKASRAQAVCAAVRACVSVDFVGEFGEFGEFGAYLRVPLTLGLRS